MENSGRDAARLNDASSDLRIIVETQQCTLGSWNPARNGLWGRLACCSGTAEPFVGLGQVAPPSLSLPSSATVASPSLSLPSSTTVTSSNSACLYEQLRNLLYEDEACTVEKYGFYLPIVDDTTDANGWIYGSSVYRITAPRLGGRAAARPFDRVRRRWWQNCQPDAGVQGVVPVTVTRQTALHSDMDTLLATRADLDWIQVQASLSEALRVIFGSSRSSSLNILSPVGVLRRGHKDQTRLQSLCTDLPHWKEHAVLAPLCLAALYARAAYGFVARMGLFDTLASGAKVFSVQKGVFDMAENVDAASNNRCLLDTMALGANDMLFANWKAQGPFCPIFAAVRDPDARWIVVTIRGTISGKDIYADVAANSTDFLEGKAHEGFLMKTQRLLQVLRARMPEKVRQYPDHRIVLCGHSMGGAIAAMAAAILNEEDDWAKGCVAYTFGTPGATSRSVAERLAAEGLVYTVVNGTDWAPRLSLSNAHELLNDVGELSLVSSFVRSVSGLLSKSEAMDTNDSRSDPGICEMLPPGRILQIAEWGSQVASVEYPHDQHHATEPLFLRARPDDYRNRMSVCPDVGAHLPIRYIQRLLGGLAVRLADEDDCAFLGWSKPQVANSPTWRFDDAVAHIGCDSIDGGSGLLGGTVALSPTEVPSSSEETKFDVVTASAKALEALYRLGRPSLETSCETELPKWPDAGRQLVFQKLKVFL